MTLVTLMFRRSRCRLDITCPSESSLLTQILEILATGWDISSLNRAVGRLPRRTYQETDEANALLISNGLSHREKFSLAKSPFLKTKIETHSNTSVGHLEDFVIISNQRIGAKTIFFCIINLVGLACTGG